jgi:hypothetical protein
MTRHVHSVIRQSLHYLARPHVDIPRAPLDVPAAWRGDELAARTDWQVPLSEADIAELDRARAHASATGRPLAQLQRDDFPLPTLGPRVRAWTEQLRAGLGVVLLRNLPVAQWGVDASSLVFWCLGLHLGRPGAQNGRGELLGRVRDDGSSYADPSVRGYKTAAALGFHTDFADIVGLLCLQAAAAGGRSRFVSSVAIYNELLRRRPDLVDTLFEPLVFDTRGDAGVDWMRVIPCRHDAGALRTLYHADYMRTDKGPAQPARVGELLDVYDAIAASPGLAIELEFRPGDVQLLSNHTVLHSRTAFVDGGEGSRRDLLRLWLSLGFPMTLRGRIARGRELLRLLGDLSAARLRGRLGAVA